MLWKSMAIGYKAAVPFKRWSYAAAAVSLEISFTRACNGSIHKQSIAFA